jgi:S1-C subfamily serine protease
MLYFTTRPLTAEQKRRLNLPIGGFASEVVEPADPPGQFKKLPMAGRVAKIGKAHDADPQAQSENLPMLKPGDIITGVEGVQESRLTQNVERYIKLTKKAGDTITLDLLRDGKPTQIKQNSFRLFYRKSRPGRNK